jgi:GNAT superfamily N-acetyltransferase
MRVIVRPAPGLVDALRMRSIRNSCRLFMTRDQSEIGRMRQAWWWGTRDSDVEPYLLDEAGHAIGYGIILRKGGKGWLTGGLLPDARGRGLGKTLFQSLCHHAKKADLQPMLEVLKSNPRAERLYYSLGFEKICETDSVYIMELPL